MLNLVTVVGRNTHLLPHMLKHYEGIVDKVYVAVYRQDENDGVLEEVLDLGIKPYIVITDEKYNWERVTAIYNFIKQTRPNDWWIVSDDDELQVYPYEISEIIKECEKHKYDFVTGGFLDRIGPDGIFPKVTRETDIHSAFPYAGFFRYPMSYACPNKVTLMKGYQDVTPGQHYASFKDGSNSWGKSHPKRFPIEEVFTQVHHFKWDSTCIQRIKEVAEMDQPWAYSHEYWVMYDAIRIFGWKIDICNPEFKVESLNNFSYIDYMDYSKWNILRDKIVTI